MISYIYEAISLDVQICKSMRSSYRSLTHMRTMVLEYLPTFALVQKSPSFVGKYSSTMVRIWQNIFPLIFPLNIIIPIIMTIDQYSLMIPKMLIYLHGVRAARSWWGFVPKMSWCSEARPPIWPSSRRIWSPRIWYGYGMDMVWIWYTYTKQ